MEVLVWDDGFQCITQEGAVWFDSLKVSAQLMSILYGHEPGNGHICRDKEGCLELRWFLVEADQMAVRSDPLWKSRSKGRNCLLCDQN